LERKRDALGPYLCGLAVLTGVLLRTKETQISAALCAVCLKSGKTWRRGTDV